MSQKTSVGKPSKKKINRSPNYDVRVASQSFSNIASVLAGFGFAAVILVLQTNLPNESAEFKNLRDWSASSFIVAFFGSILSAFTFAVISGEEELSPRSHHMSLLGGIGLALSTTLIMWSTVNLLKIFLSSQVNILMQFVFPVIVSIAPLYLAYSAVDPIYGFDKRSPKLEEWMKVLIPGYFPLIIVIVLKLFLVITYSTQIVSLVFNQFIFAILVMMILSAGMTLNMTTKKLETRLSLGVAGLLIFISSVLISIMIILN